LRLIAGLNSPDAGIIRWDDKIITDLTFYQRSKLFLGMVFQRPTQGCAPVLTVEQNLQLAAMKGKSFTFGTSIDPAVLTLAQSYADMLNIDLCKILDRPMGQLSGGQQQMIVFIMVLLSKPALLLLDEPTAALSPQSVQLFTAVLLKWHQEEKSTIICVTHDLGFAGALATQIHELQPQGLHFYQKT
jgi:putative ABC transport system ATP-binding protein